MKRIVVTLYRKRESLKVKLSNNLLVAVLQAMLAVCRGISLKQISRRQPKNKGHSKQTA